MTAKSFQKNLSRLSQAVRDKTADYKSRGSLVIVAFGDSITMGATDFGVFDFEAVYHHRLKQMIGQSFPGPAGGTVSMINSGIGGDTAWKGLQRLDRDVIRYQPDLVIVAFGANDLGGSVEQDAFRTSLMEIVTRIRSETPADIILVTPPFMAARDVGGVPPEYQDQLQRLIRLQTEGIVARYAQTVREIGDLMDIPVADVYSAWREMSDEGVDTTALLANGLNHPNAEMHKIPAALIFDIVESAFIK